MVDIVYGQLQQLVFGVAQPRRGIFIDVNETARLRINNKDRVVGVLKKTTKFILELEESVCYELSANYVCRTD